MSQGDWAALTEVLEETAPVVEAALGEERARALREELTRAFGERRVQVLIHGAYNAGKSTLINALRGEAVAPVGEVPTTDRVARYPWEGIELVDTPGVNAPIEHEELTEEALKRVALVVFVIRQGDQDVADVYARMFRLLQAGKEIFIVFNHQADARELPELLRRLQELLSRQSRRHGVAVEQAGRMPIHPVDLFTAWQARQTDNAALLDDSGLPELEAALRQWLAGFEREDFQLSAMARRVEATWLLPALERLTAPDDTQEDASSELQDRRQALEAERSRLTAELSSVIDREVHARRGAVEEALRGLIEAHPEGGAPGALEPVLDRIFQPVTGVVQEELARRLGEAPTLKCELSAVDLPEVGGANAPGAVRDAAAKLAKQVASDPEMIKQGLLFLRAMKVPVLKGRWEKTLARWAGRGAVVIQALWSLAEIYSASRKQEEENRRRRELALALAQESHRICDEVAAAYREQIRDTLDRVYQEPLREVQSAIDERLAQRDEAERRREHLRKAQARLRAIQIPGGEAKAPE